MAAVSGGMKKGWIANIGKSGSVRDAMYLKMHSVKMSAEAKARVVDENQAEHDEAYRKQAEYGNYKHGNGATHDTYYYGARLIQNASTQYAPTWKIWPITAVPAEHPDIIKTASEQNGLKFKKEKEVN